MAYIERGALKENICKRVNNSVIQGWLHRIINDIPTADVVEVRHAKWKVVYQNKIATVYECSECSHLTFGTSNYCICGAKMDGKDGE